MEAYLDFCRIWQLFSQALQLTHSFSFTTGKKYPFSSSFKEIALRAQESTHAAQPQHLSFNGKLGMHYSQFNF
jgi:hypothetical protein